MIKKKPKPQPNKKPHKVMTGEEMLEKAMGVEKPKSTGKMLEDMAQELVV